MNILYASIIDISLEKANTIHFLHLAYALQGRGHNIRLVARGEPPTEVERQLRGHFIPKMTIFTKLQTLSSDFLLFLFFIRLSFSTNFDILYHRDVPLANYWARILGIPSIVEVNGIYVDELRSAGRHKTSIWLYQQREKLAIRSASKVICVTDGIREQLVNRYKVPFDRCVVIPNATDITLFRPLSKRECQEQLGISSQKYIVGFVGSFQPWIDFDMLLEAIRSLHLIDIPVHCILVGSGNQYGEVEEYIEKYQLSDIIQLVGQVPHSQIPNWIGSFDVCIAPSGASYVQTIGKSSMKLFEYMACARPVIATALSGIVDVLESSQGGLLYDVGDSDMLVQQLNSIYRDPRVGESMGIHGREYVVQHHSWDNVAEHLENIMQELVNK